MVELHPVPGALLPLLLLSPDTARRHHAGGGDEDLQGNAMF